MSQRTYWPDVVGRFRLGWRLLRDPLVPGWTKLIPLGALAYILLPVDIIPDMFLGLGQLDDLGVLLLGLRAFIAVCPQAVVLRHQAAMSAVDGVAREVNEIPLEITTPTGTRGSAGARMEEEHQAPPPAQDRSGSADGREVKTGT